MNAMAMADLTGDGARRWWAFGSALGLEAMLVALLVAWVATHPAPPPVQAIPLSIEAAVLTRDHAPVFLQQFLRGNGFAKDGARAQHCTVGVLAVAAERLGLHRYMPLMICSSVPAVRPGMA